MRETPETAGRAMMAQTPARILVIDDAAVVRQYHRKILEQAGHAVSEAVNGMEAIEKLLQEPFDLCIVDVNMPVMDGYSFLRARRRSADLAMAAKAQPAWPDFCPDQRGDPGWRRESRNHVRPGNPAPAGAVRLYAARAVLFSPEWRGSDQKIAGGKPPRLRRRR